MVKLVNQRTTDGIPAMLRQLSSFVGESDLSKQLKRVRTKIAHQAVVSAEVQDRFSIPLSLARLYEQPPSTYNALLASDPAFYNAVAFAFGVVEFARHLSAKGSKVLRGKTMSALDPSNDARPLAHEFRVAFHFSQQEWDVELSDFEGRTQYDFIVRKADQELEVECKAITGDRGNAVHREEFNSFGNAILRDVSALHLSQKHLRIDIALPARMPKGAAARELVNAVLNVLADYSVPIVVEGATVTLSPVDPAKIDARDVGGSGQRLLAEIREERNGSVFGIFDATQFLAVHVYSERRSRVSAEIAETVERAAAQLSMERPGLIWTHMVDLTNDELKSLNAIYKSGEYTLLEAVAHKMFVADEYGHVAALLFSAEAPVQRAGGPDSLIIHAPFYKQSGAIYPLWNRNCLYNQPFRPLI